MSTTGRSQKTGLESWKQRSPPMQWRREGATCLLKQFGGSVGVVWIGGISKEGETSCTVELFEWRLGKWWVLPPLLQARAGCATACARGSTIFVIGGYQVSTGSALASGESLEFGTTHQWKPLTSNMKTPRWHCAAVALSRPEVIMVVGGRDERWKELSSVESFDVSSDAKWKTMPPMKTARLAPAAVAIGLSRIMVMGGYDGKSYLNTVESFDWNDGEWIEMSPMPIPCAFASAVSVVQEGRFVLVFGGVEDTTKQVVQIYSVRDRAWRLMETLCPPMNQSCLVTAVDQNLLLISEDELEEGKGNVTMSYALSTISINELWEESTVSRTSVEESQEQQQWQTIGPPERMSLAHVSSNLTESERRLPVATSVVAIPMGHSSLEQLDPPSLERDLSADTKTSVENMHMVDDKGRDAWYTGEISVRSQRPHGKGRMVLDFEADTYDGEWKHGLRHGFGQYSYASGDCYEGFFDMDKKSGRGSYAFRDGRQYDGKYVNDECEDRNGVMTWKDGARYVGGFVKGKREGQGRMVFADGKTSYDGEYSNNKYDGMGTFRYPDGRVYVGKFRRGKANGRGKLTDKNGVVLYDGMWKNDEPA